jgi:hypothetical protein
MKGIEIIAAERQRQIEKEGFTGLHDSQHTDESLAMVAASYALPPYLREKNQIITIDFGKVPRWWPLHWNLNWWKPTPMDRIRELSKAGALCAAEIDRIQARKI